MNFHNARFASNVHQMEALTLDDIRRVAPSAFAQHPHESRSARYAYIPTSEVIAAMMSEGFQPFRACQSPQPDAVQKAVSESEVADSFSDSQHWRTLC